MNMEILMLVVGIVSAVGIIVTLIAFLISYRKIKKLIFDESSQKQEILFQKITEAVDRLEANTKFEINKTNSELKGAFKGFETTQNENSQKIYELVSGTLKGITAEITVKFMQFQDTVMLHDNALQIKNNKWILEKNNIEKIFIPGKLQEVKNGTNITQYEHQADEIIATTLEANKEKAQIVFSSFGAPKRGKIFDENGNISQEFIYDEFGQIKEVK